MIRNWQLATALAIAISAGGTSSSVLAGGHGGFGGGGFSGGSGHSHSSHSHSGGFNNGSSRIMQSGGNLGGSNLGHAAQATPKNTGVVPPIVKTGGTNSTGGGIKLPGNLANNHGNQSSNIAKKISGGNSNVSSQVLSGLGIKIGSGNGPGAGQVPGSGNGNGNSNGPCHHHHCPPLVFTLPTYNSGYYYPPCPPIYYPQPVPIPVPVPVADPNQLPVPAPGPMGDPMPAPTPVPTVDPALVANNNPMPTAPVEQPEPTPVSAPTNAQPADSKPADPQLTEVVSKPVPLPQVPVGATLTLQGQDLSDKQGQVVLQMGEIALPATIKEWKNNAVVCTLPVVGLTRPSKATLHVLKADGKIASTMNVELVTTLPSSAEASPETLSKVTGFEANKYEP